MEYKISLKMATVQDLLKEYKQVLIYGPESAAEAVEDEIIRRIGYNPADF